MAEPIVPELDAYEFLRCEARQRSKFEITRRIRPASAGTHDRSRSDRLQRARLARKPLPVALPHVWTGRQGACRRCGVSLLRRRRDVLAADPRCFVCRRASHPGRGVVALDASVRSHGETRRVSSTCLRRMARRRRSRARARRRVRALVAGTPGAQRAARAKSAPRSSKKFGKAACAKESLAPYARTPSKSCTSICARDGSTKATSALPAAR